MPRDTATLGDGPPNLYSLQDLRRIGPKTSNDLYTLNELGYILLFLTLLDGGNRLCAECFGMGTGKSPCPHGTFPADNRLAPVLVWPEDSSVCSLSAPHDYGVQHAVTVKKSLTNHTTAKCVYSAQFSSCPEYHSQPPPRAPALRPGAFSPQNRATFLSAFAATSNFATSRTQAFSSTAVSSSSPSPSTSSVAAAAIIAVPSGLPSFSLPPSIPTLPAFSSAPSPVRADTLVNAIPTNQRQVVQLAPSVDEHASQYAYYHYHRTQHPAVSPPGLPSLHGVVPRDPNYCPHLDPYDSSVNHWYIVIVGRTVGVFKDPLAGFESTHGVPGHNWERRETYALAIALFREQERKNIVVQVQI